MAMIDETQEADQLNVGIKIIQTAFYNQTSFLQREISLLSHELQAKNDRIAELEQVNISLVSEKEDYDNTIQNLLAKNSRLTQLLDGHYAKPKSIDKDYTAKPLIDPDFNSFSSLNAQCTKHNLKMNRSASNLFLPSKGQANSVTNIDTLLAGFDETITKIKKYNNSTSSHLKKSPSFIGTSEAKRPPYKKATQQGTDDEQANSESINANTYTINNNADFNRRSEHNRQRELVVSKGDFFKKCRALMTSQDYSHMLEVIRLANNYQITKEETYDRISFLLEKKYQQLVGDFEELIFKR